MNQARAAELAQAMLLQSHRRTDRLFAGLLACEWAAGVGLALWLSPKTWAGPTSQTHLHVWAALVLGFAVVSLPIWLAITQPGRTASRHVIAAGQMLMSALLIHLTGGRIETHFHVFGSLAFLSFYRDWRVLITASAVVAADHYLRGALWPESVYGTAIGAEWRWLEHAGWVVFLDLFLGWSCLQGCREIARVAEQLAALEASQESLMSIIDNALDFSKIEAKKLERLMGGSIVVESELGRGSTFRFSALVKPIATQPTPPSPAEAPQGPRANEPREAIALNVLLAEDNPINQRVAAKMLSIRGHAATIVDDGRKALEALAGASFDIVLMDVQMPLMDGFAATAAIRLREGQNDADNNGDVERAYIVAMTAHAMKGDRERCLEAGMDDYLSKPIDAGELDRVLATAAVRRSERPSETELNPTISR